MWKIGDKIVCIDDSFITKMDGYSDSYLTNGKMYEIILSPINDAIIYIDNDEGTTKVYSTKRFISLLDYRRKKLKMICSKMEI